MLRVTPNTSADGTHKYFFGYYSEQELDTSKWYGKAAEKLGLSGKIQEKDFESICHNLNPETGNQLTAQNRQDRIVGYDFTFSVPKSVSLIHALTQDKEILEGFNNAVIKTMKEIEENAETRVRINGKQENRTTGNLIYCTFTHGETRPAKPEHDHEIITEKKSNKGTWSKEGIPDPHLHKHVFIFNATYDDQEEKWKAAKFRNLKADAPYYEAVFRSRFAEELKNIGYQVDRNKNDFEIKGFDRPLIKKFSNRTKQIEDKAKELGITFAEDKGALGAKTRVQKRKDLDREELKKMWDSRLTDKERQLVYNAKNAPSPNDGGSPVTPSQALEYSLSHNLERKSTVSEKDIYIHALKRSYGFVTPEELKNELLKRKDLLSKTNEHGTKIYTTQEALREESLLKKSAREGRGVMKPINEGYAIKNDKLTTEQANAVQHVLKSEDFITIVSGEAGTGKTWSVKEVAEGVKEKGVNFGAFAPSSVASRQVQREDGFKNATTITELLKSEKLQKTLKHGIIWIDEAGMVGNKTMNDIIDVAKKQEARILLTGDIKQHNSVERGDALRVIQKYGGIKPVRISKIQRQKKDNYKQAVSLISEGKMQAGIQALDGMNAIKEAEDLSSLKNNVANEYVAAIKDRQETLVVATTHAQGKAVTETIREKLKSEKLISDKEKAFTSLKNLSFTEVEKKDLANYQSGMCIQFHQNVSGGIKRGTKYQVEEKDKAGNVVISEISAIEKKKITLPIEAASKFSVYEQNQISISKGDKIRITQNGFSESRQRLNNGNIFSVKGFDENGNIIATTGKRDLVLNKHYGNLTHGYYTTSPASQGKSVNRVIVVQSSMSGRAASKEQFYVSASRGKFAISIHTDDKKNLLQSVSRSTQRMTATEIAEESKSTKIAALKDKFKKFDAIYQTVKSKVAGFKNSRHKESIFKMIPKPVKQVSHATPIKGR